VFIATPAAFDGGDESSLGRGRWRIEKIIARVEIRDRAATAVERSVYADSEVGCEEAIADRKSVV